MKKATLSMITDGQKWHDVSVTKLSGLFRYTILKHHRFLLFELPYLF